MIKKISFIILLTTTFAFTTLGDAKANPKRKNQFRSYAWPEAVVFTNKEMTNLDIVDRSYAEKIESLKGSEPMVSKFYRWLKIIDDSNQGK